MKQKEIDTWEGVRAKGMGRYIVLNGMLGWGLFMFVAMTFFVNRGTVKTPTMLAVSLLIWMAGGALFGGATWTLNEKRYLKALEQK